MTEDSSTTVRLTYKNYEFEVTVDQETCNRINNDEGYKEDFARQTYESLENDGHFIEESNEDVKFPTTPNFKWTKPGIDQLINIRFSRNDEFNNPSTRKSLLWQSVASTLENKYPGVTGEMCDAKYRNLLHTYKLNKQKQTKYGLESVKWEYFDQFDESLGLQMNSMSQKDVGFFDSLLASDDCDEFNKQDLIILPSGSPEPADISSRKRSASQEMSIGQYLRIKAENDIRNMKLKARIWKEKKQLKEREISAILQLAKALKNKK